MNDLEYDPARTALLVVDPYNDFISEGGKLYALSRETITSQDCVTHMRQVLAAARAAGMLVCYARTTDGAPATTTPGTTPPPHRSP